MGGAGARLDGPAGGGGPFAYVTNASSGTVSVIYTATNTVVATVPVGSFPLGSPSPRMGHTPMSRIAIPTMSR